MRYRRVFLPRKTIDEFAEEHGLTMFIGERTPFYWPMGKRYYAHFDEVETARDGFLISDSGNGDTETEAIAAYARQISCATIVHRALGEDRREIAVPLLYNELDDPR